MEQADVELPHDGPGGATDETPAPSSLVPVTAVPATGDDRVDAALDRLASLDQLPLAAQVTVFDDVHRLLQDALTATDQAGPPASETVGR